MDFTNLVVSHTISGSNRPSCLEKTRWRTDVLKGLQVLQVADLVYRFVFLPNAIHLYFIYLFGHHVARS